MRFTESSSFIKWLKRENLYSYAEKYHPKFRNVLTDCLGVNKKYPFLISGDIGTPGFRVPALMAACYIMEARKMGIDYKLAIHDPIPAGEDADPYFIEAVSSLPEGSTVALSLSWKIGSMKRLGKSFRKLALKKRDRFVSTTTLSQLKTKQFLSLVKAVDVDYKLMQKRATEIKSEMQFGKEIHVTAGNGTDLWYNIKGMHPMTNDGDYRLRGGNLPAGEVYIPPRGKKVEGKIVIDLTSKNKNGTIILKEPIKLTIEKGSIIEINGGVGAKLLEESFIEAENRAKYPWGIRRVGELGIGINPNADITSATIITEKRLGTAHFGIGSNSWFGGTIYAITHFDQVFDSPNIIIDRKKLKIK